MLNPVVRNRIENWKFSSAKAALDSDATEGERHLVEVLATQCGNSDWFDGALGELVSVAVAELLKEKTS